MYHVFTWLLLFLCLSVCSPQAFANMKVNYSITPSDDFKQFKVEVCFVNQVPDALFNGHYGDNTWLLSVAKANGQKLTAYRGRIALAGVKVGDCIDYKVRLSKGQQRRRAMYRAGKDLIINNYVWLWQPKSLSVADKVRLQFNLPTGFNLSTPWPVVGDNQVELTTTPYYWDGRIAIGQFNVVAVNVASQQLQVAVLNSSKKRRDEYIGWIKQAAEAVSGINGQYPVDQAQVIVVPIGKQREAVPWGEVQRGGRVAAHFFVDSERDIQQFKDDWTAAHELSHMLVPYIDRDELFLSEGIASYYQNVARAQAGMITARQAWDKLLAGFKRGFNAANKRAANKRAANKSAANNSAESNNTVASGARMQLYWGGAALYLMADHALRQKTKHFPVAKRVNLATILKRFNRCCQPSTSVWSGERLMRRFDQLAAESIGESDIFISLYRQAQRQSFMTVIPVLDQLGFNGMARRKWQGLSVEAKAIMAAPL